MAKKISTVMGVLFFLGALVGFVAPHFMGMHLSLLHNTVHALSGAISLYFGIQGTESGARNWSRTIGIIYGLLAVVGLLGPNPMTIIPEHLVLGPTDDIIHVIFASVFIFAGFAPRKDELVGQPGTVRDRVGVER